MGLVKKQVNPRWRDLRSKENIFDSWRWQGSGFTDGQGLRARHGIAQPILKSLECPDLHLLEHVKLWN